MGRRGKRRMGTVRRKRQGNKREEGGAAAEENLEDTTKGR
jgi:hypothetical protein